jgi:phosphatidate cytidylyltransferase
VATAAIGIPIVLAVDYFGAGLFALMAGLAALVGIVEFCQMMRAAGYRASFVIGLIVTPLLAILPLYVRHVEAAWIGIVMLLIGVTGTYFLLPFVFRGSLMGWATTVAGTLYIGLCLGHLSLLRTVHDGAWWVLLALLATWAYDTGAYFTGRAIGRRPFMAHVSPSKTFEGVTGGLALSMIVGLFATFAVGLLVWQSLFLGLLLGVVAQIGDLVESMIKRQSGVKDSGTLFPGHGGLLDRVDSLLFTGVATYYSVLLFTGHGA